MATASATTTGIDFLTALADPTPLLDRVEEIMDAALEKGERTGKDAIATRGTGRTWAYARNGRTGSYPGRVDSGDMQDDFKGRITDRTRTSVTGTIGWQDGSPLYYKLQEEGFTHVVTGDYIEGMRALRDSADATVREIVRELQDIAEVYE